jgi:hypothetical protein
MPVDDELDGPAKFREIAATLREIAASLRFDQRRVAQLNALADGFERYAGRLDREAETPT